jgi:nitroreductase/NAD-dependent dihydropyrimidine dehydrogenase PreA subunit
MSYIIVNESKCNSCGICAEVCPVGLIFMRKKTNRPVSFKNAENYCIRCGHCVSACSESAISTADMKSESCQKIDYSNFPNSEQVDKLFKSRRSIRNFTNEKIPSDIIEKIIRISDYAPSGHNLRILNWLVIQEEEELIKLKGIVIDWMKDTIKNNSEMAKMLHLENVIAAWDRGEDRILRNAPQLIVSYSNADSKMANTTATIALSYIELATYSYKAGACWAGYFHLASIFYPPMLKALNLPDGANCCGAMMVGYPKYKYYKIPLRKKSNIIWK